jgi:hypothetical protein
MGTGSDYQYHVERARTEMDRAYQARLPVAAAAHMKLSALHMAQARLAVSSEQGSQRRGGPDAGLAAGAAE